MTITSWAKKIQDSNGYVDFIFKPTVTPKYIPAALSAQNIRLCWPYFLYFTRPFLDCDEIVLFQVTKIITLYFTLY